MRRSALTLVELVVVLAIIGVLIALLLPAVQAARESTRRVKCSSNLRQVALALHQYESTYRVLPAPGRKNYSFYVRLLPQLEQSALYAQFDFEANALDWEGPLDFVRLSVLECPSDGGPPTEANAGARTNYHGNWGTGSQRFGNNGVFSYRSDHPGFVAYLPLSAITDGLSQTAMIAEVLAFDPARNRVRALWETPPLYAPNELEAFRRACLSAPRTDCGRDPLSRGRPWLESGIGKVLYNHIVTPNQPSCSNGGLLAYSAFTASSSHRNGINVANADASVGFVGDSIDADLWQKLGSRAGD